MIRMNSKIFIKKKLVRCSRTGIILQSNPLPAIVKVVEYVLPFIKARIYYLLIYKNHCLQARAIIKSPDFFCFIYQC